MIEITLPFPPSVNTYWRNFNGRTILSAKGREYRLAVEALLHKQNIDLKLTTKLKVEIEAFRPDNRRRDLDNLLKAPLDALGPSNVYEDDSQIVDLRIYWAEDKRGILKVKIWEVI
jgi:crossover junction endodeoxyribonuclease RusA